jgi:hypothetical protein
MLQRQAHSARNRLGKTLGRPKARQAARLSDRNQSALREPPFSPDGNRIGRNVLISLVVPTRH